MKKSRLAFIVATMVIVSIGSYYVLIDHLNVFVASIQQDTSNAIEILTNSAKGGNTVELSKATHFVRVIGSPHLLVAVVKPLIYLIILLVTWLFLISIYYELKLLRVKRSATQDK